MRARSLLLVEMVNLGLVGLGSAGCTFELSEPNRTVIAAGSTWSFEDRQAAPDGWQTASFDDASWPTGAAPLGYDCAEKTTLWFGGCSDPDGCNKPITTYFRQAFTFFPSGWSDPILRLQRDDGARVFLNGEEVLRTLLPAGAIDADTTAEFVEEPQPTFHRFSLPLDALLEGENLIAVEIHQANAESSDLCFDLELSATPGD